MRTMTAPTSRMASLLVVAAPLLGSVALAQPRVQDAAQEEPGVDSLDARARRLDEQEAQVEALRAQLEVLLDQAAAAETATPPAEEPGSDLHEGGSPDAGLGRDDEFIDPGFLKSVPLFGSDWRFSFGGYAKVDLLHDFAGTGDKMQFTLDTIPVDGDPPPGSYSNLQAAETRINFEVRDTGGSETSRFFVEFDFFDPTLSPRLRHAYFEYGNLLAGQTWTTLTELRQLPFLLDFAAGDSLYGGRTQQIRWQATATESLSWAVALENFDDENLLIPDDVQGTARSNFPSLVGRTTYDFGGSVVTVGASLGQNRWDGGGSAGDATSLFWSAMIGGRVYVDTEREDFVGFGASYSEGTPDTIISLAEAGTPRAVLRPNGELENVPAWNVQLGFHKAWSPQWSSNFSLAYAELDPVPGLPGDSLRIGSAFHGNVIRDLGTRMKVGLEYMHGIREVIDGGDGTANRVQFSLIYYF